MLAKLHDMTQADKLENKPQKLPEQKKEKVNKK